MHGMTKKRTKSKKAKLQLRRPQGYAAAQSGRDAATTTFNNNPPGYGSGGTDDVDARNSGNASTFVGHPNQDPLASLYPQQPDKIYFRGKAKGEEELEEAIQAPLQHEPALRTILHGQLVEQAGGHGNISPTMAGLLGTIIEQRILETKINRALAKHGSLRINHKSGKVTGQAIIKDLLLPLQASLRMNLKQYADECARLTLNGRRPQNPNAPLTAEGKPYPVDVEDLDDLTALNQLNLLLGKPEQTEVEARADFNAWGYKTRLAGGALPELPPATKEG